MKRLDCLTASERSGGVKRGGIVFFSRKDAKGTGNPTSPPKPLPFANEDRIMKRLVKAFALALIGLLLIGTVVYAAIATPAPYAVYQTNVYRNCLEANDQMWIIVGEIEYGANPAEDAGEAFIVRVLDEDDNELKATAPYPYHDSGYDLFCVGIYFGATDEDIPLWSGNYTVELTGNPALTWTAGDPPTTSNDIISSWSEAAFMTPRVRYIALELDDDWGVDLISLEAGVNKFMPAGEVYFEASIASLRIICPDLFSSAVVVPEFEEREYTQAEATTTETRWIGDGLLDFTGLAGVLGVSRMWTTSLLWIVLCCFICFYSAQRVESYRLMAFLLAILLAFGALIGLMPFVVAPIMGFLCIVGLVYTVAWSSGQ